MKKSLKMLKGLNNLQVVYHRRHPHDNHEGLKELRQLHGNAQKFIHDHAVLLGLDFDTVSTEIAKSSQNLQAYCKRCASIDDTAARQRILGGQYLMKGIMGNTPILPSESEEISRAQLAQISWFLMYYALQKKQGFYEGTFIIEESEKLFCFLRLTQATKARPCTHFEQRPSESGKSPCGPRGDAGPKREPFYSVWWLPSSKVKMFYLLKPEEALCSVTTTYSDWWGHAFETVLSLWQ